METEKITLEPAVKFNLSVAELKKLYLALALVNYDFLCRPNYDEKKLLTYLARDFRLFMRKTQCQYDKNLNDLELNKKRIFFDKHYNFIKKVLEEEGIILSKNEL